MKTAFQVLLIAILFVGCSRDETLLPGLEGSLVGMVFTFDEFGNLLDDHSDVAVSALGPDKVYQTLTEPSGRYELKHLPTGTYELHFEKPGYGTMKQFEVQHLGGKPTIFGLGYYVIDNSYAIYLYELPTTTCTNLYVENDSLIGAFSFTGQIPDRIGLQMYFSSVPDFSREEATCSFYRRLYNDEGIFRNTMTYWCFESGEEVYCKAYILAEGPNFYLYFQNNVLIVGIDSYTDHETNETIYPSLGDEIPVFSFICP